MLEALHSGLQLCDCIACVPPLLLALAGSQRLLYRLFYRIQASSLWWLRLTGVLAVLGIQSAPLTRCPGSLNPLLSDSLVVWAHEISFFVRNPKLG